MADLRARCDTCVRRDDCATAGVLSEYPACHRPIRRTKLPRLAALLRACADHHRIDPRRRDAVIDAIVEHHARDREHYSEIVELSAARAGTDELLFRFSYGFPGFRRDPGHAASFGHALASLYGDACTRALEHCLELAESAAVTMPLMGLEERASGAFRFKLYLQLAPDAGEDALALASRWSGGEDWTHRFAGRSLHMVGMDVSTTGISGAKLYFDASPLALDAPWLARSGLVADLRAAGLAELEDALAIHVFRGAADPAGDTPSRLDFGLARNEVPWGAMRTLPRFRAAGPRALAALGKMYRLAIRRLSVAVAGDDGMTAYYVLAEHDEQGLR